MGLRSILAPVTFKPLTVVGTSATRSITKAPLGAGRVRSKFETTPFGDLLPQRVLVRHASLRKRQREQARTRPHGCLRGLAESTVTAGPQVVIFVRCSPIRPSSWRGDMTKNSIAAALTLGFLAFTLSILPATAQRTCHWQPHAECGAPGYATGETKVATQGEGSWGAGTKLYRCCTCAEGQIRHKGQCQQIGVLEGSKTGKEGGFIQLKPPQAQQADDDDDDDDRPKNKKKKRHHYDDDD